ncbi:carotenoid 9,10(9',10')-cleavage dioxygenase 1 isoform X3 [Abrus precatorius]|uniref:carotenoid 9,10-dioxygenase n=1 Tax=Abrus precatorius TaxID=3816 RepID=A0A8B8LL33_ABRPR|nr:carotenoid 9,10(9',10')-cleavage dioxygenase 1 isoform X3 [Abrus precatorius]
MEDEKKIITGEGIVKVEPKPSNGFTSKVIDLLEKLVVKFLYDSSLPQHYLSGNFSPVPDETPPTMDLPVKGYLPDCLNGEFVRVGPNPKFAPVAGYHWFDGDGMIHGLRIKDGKATYVSRFVRTSRLKQEEYFGGSKFMKIGDLKGLFGLLMVNIHMLRIKWKVLDVSYGTSTANTALVYHHGKLLALSEADKPYAIKVFEDGDLQTLGILDYDKRLGHSFTAHPKVDPYSANAWEEEDEVVLITCRLENPNLDMVSGAVKEKLENFSNELYEMRFNMKTGEASQKKLSAPAVDFPRVNESYTGRKQRYVYGTTLDSIAKVTGIIKFDLHAESDSGKTKLEVGGNVQGLYDLGPGQFGSEAIYVPRVPGTNSEEDDGYLIFFVHDENTGKSFVHVIDAKTMSADPVAVVELPHRVPYGFHAFFVTEEQLQEQGKL